MLSVIDVEGCRGEDGEGQNVFSNIVRKERRDVNVMCAWCG